MKRVKKTNIEWKGKIKGKEYSDILFEELSISKGKIINVEFKNIHFKNCLLGQKTEYIESNFVNCKFFGKYSSLGSPSKFSKCRFENCQFVGIDLFHGTNFHKCEFSGSMKNHILYDKSSKFKGWETEFIECDFSQLTFDHLNIYGKNIFKNCVLPKNGIRLYRNSNDELIQRSEDICSHIDTDHKIESEVIFRRSMMTGQDPIIIDDLFLESFFKTVESRRIFDEIVEGYQLN